MKTLIGVVPVVPIPDPRPGTSPYLACSCCAKVKKKVCAGVKFKLFTSYFFFSPVFVFWCVFHRLLHFTFKTSFYQAGVGISSNLSPKEAARHGQIRTFSDPGLVKWLNTAFGNGIRETARLQFCINHQGVFGAQLGA